MERQLQMNGERSKVETLKQSMRSALVAIAVVSAAGCGSNHAKNPLAPGSPVSPAVLTGAPNMVVNATVAGTPAGAGTFQTDFTVQLADTLGGAISGATVAISGAAGNLALVEDGGTPGTYRASLASYTAGNYQLDITAGAQQVTAAQVAAPDLHAITSPAANDTIQAHHPCHMSWTHTTNAQYVQLASLDWTGTASTLDSGTGNVPTPGNPARNDQQFSVTRWNSASILDARTGSHFDASIRNAVGPVIAQ